MSIKVAVVNDSELVIAGVEALLGSYKNRALVVALDPGVPLRGQVDILLYDPTRPLSLPGQSLGPPCTPSSPVRLVALGWELDPGRVRAVIRKGVDGYIFMGLAEEEFVDALERVHRGELVTPAVGVPGGRLIYGRSRTRATPGPYATPAPTPAPA